MKTMKKRIASISLATVLVLSFTGCGNAVPNEKGSEKCPDEVTKMIEDGISPDEIIADAGEPVEQSEKADRAAETIAPAETEKSAQTAEPIATEEPSEVVEKPVANEKPVVAEKPVETVKPANNQIVGTVPSGHAPSAPKGAEAEESKPAESESVGSEQPHEHNWIAHTDQRWVSQIVTVVDEPERYEKYDTYLIYWYNTGEWEETRDPSRFAAWWRDKEGGPTSESASFKNYEDNPLFLGYDEYGHPSFTGDHVIWTDHGYIPAVTHEEDQGYYETYADYYYCDCGATK